MKQSFRKLYCAEEAYPDLYIAAKLYVASSKVLNAYLSQRDAHEDDIQTLVFYTGMASHRAGISAEELDEVYKNRDTVYNSRYNCKEHLTAADLASFLVAKSLRLKNILATVGTWHRDSVIDFAIYLQMLRQKLGLL